MMHRPALVILGASTRAAAFSAIRAGFDPYCFDLFADVDLVAVCPVRRCVQYPQDLGRWEPTAPGGAWMYTGALENYPDLVDSIAGRRHLYGNAASVLRRARDPLEWSGVVRAEGLPCPQCSLTAPRSAHEAWLVKGIRSSGGMRIRAWEGADPVLPAGGDWYFQERIQGTSCSALYLGTSGRAWLWGVSEQLTAAGGDHARDFRYYGSVGPLRLPAEQTGPLERLGNALARQLGLVGLFGIDGVMNAEGFWPVEINPRYTASVEVLERASRLSGVEAHVAACEGRLPQGAAAVEGWHGKAILYARHSGRTGAALTKALIEENLGREWPAAADVPAAGTALKSGQPVATLLGSAPDREMLLLLLQEKLARWRHVLERGE